MAADIWFQRDVARILTALTAAGSERGQEYHKALADVGLAFGLQAGSIREASVEEVETAYSLIASCTDLAR